MNSIENLQEIIRQFCSERDWDQFHGLKDLAIGISTEAAEILELVRFKSDSELEQLLKQSDFREKIEHELSDVFFFVLRISQINSIDLEKVFLEKMRLNAIKYPVDKAKGSNKKYSEY